MSLVDLAAVLEVNAHYDGVFAAARAERARTGRDAIDIALERMGLAAPRVLIGAGVKARARAFRAAPWTLDIIPGLSAASGVDYIIAFCAGMLEHMPRARWTGMGGEVPRINLQGALLYARWLRRVVRAAERAVTVAA